MITYEIRDLFFHVKVAIKHQVNIWRIEKVTGRPTDHDWQILRRIILEKYEYKCINCERDNGRLDIHHVVPVDRGGSNRLSNLVVLCFGCHKRIHPWLER